MEDDDDVMYTTDQLEQQHGSSSEDEEDWMGRRRKAVKARSSKQSRRMPPAPGGGARALGSLTKVTLGRYTAALGISCKDCGGGPHQAVTQAPDQQVEAFLAEVWQGESVTGILGAWKTGQCPVQQGLLLGCPCQPSCNSVWKMVASLCTEVAAGATAPMG